MNGGAATLEAGSTRHITNTSNQNQNPQQISPQTVTHVNSFRIGIVADKLAMSALNHRDDPQKFFHLCLSLARGIDYGVANNEPPAQASRLTPVLKQVCGRKKEFYLQSAIMVLMISVKNACKLGWFNAKDTEELLTLSNEVGTHFETKKEITNETSDLMPVLSSVMSRYYPVYKLGCVMASLEVKAGYGSYLMDFHITKDMAISKDERIRLVVVARDNLETSSCIISPQQVNILLNGRPVDKRTNVSMDSGPQPPTIVNGLLKYGTNLLQAVGQFNGSYILVIAAITIRTTSDLPAPQDYVQPDTILSGPDSEIIEGASRISLNCPISYRRIKIPAKGHQCKHYQCFDLSNYVEINSKRPSWRCPHCNQSAGFTDLRVDRMLVKVLQEAGENVSEVTIYADGSWKVASSSGKDNSSEKATNKEGENETNECFGISDGQCNIFDLTGEDCEMDIDDVHGYVDKKPVLRGRQGEFVFSYAASPSNPRSAVESFQFPASQAANSNIGIASVQTDAVSPSLSQPNNFQGTDLPMSSVALSQLSHTESLQLADMYYGPAIPRNVSRIPSAIQALPVQMPTQNPQQNVRPVMSPPATSGTSFPFQMPHASTSQAASSVANSVDLQRQHQLQMPIQNPQQNGRPIMSLPATTGPSFPFQMPHASTSLTASSVANSVDLERQHQLQMPTQNPQQNVRPIMSLPATAGPSFSFQMPHASTSQAANSVGNSVELQRQHQLQQSHIDPFVSNMPTASMQNRGERQGGVMSAPRNNNSWARHQQLSQPPHLMRSPQTLSQPPHLVRSSQVSRTHPQQVVPTGVGPNIQRVQLTSSQPSPRQHSTFYSPPHLVRTSSSTPLTPAAMPQAVSRTENLIDLGEQTWRPTGRMRGALTGQAYSAALSQYMSPGSAPNPRPPTTTDNHLQALLDTNRMIARAAQMPTTNGATTGSQGEECRGIN